MVKLDASRKKADKFKINLKKAWWNEQEYDEIPKAAPYIGKNPLFCDRDGMRQKHLQHYVKET